jgi:nicotinate-nucleotide adenylyltransferase
LKLAILGGSFDPVHIGHLLLADEVIRAFGYDRVILVPAFQSPFKINAEKASSQERLLMLAASIAGDPRLTIDDCEIRREGVSYTIDTLKDIIDRYKPEAKPGLIIGDDLASTFSKWRSPEEIAELADIIIARRMADACCPATLNVTLSATPAATPAFKFPYPHKTLDNEIMNVASHKIREKIAQDTAWRYLVPSGARHIIEDKGLYGFTARPAGETEPDSPPSLGLKECIIRIEKDVRFSLDFSRFIHSRNTALLAWDLCRRFGLDSQKGYLAGIAHDMCKSFDKTDLVSLAYKDGGSISKLEQKKPGLLHARAAAVLLEKKYGINDRDILDAIRYHTTGNWDMDSLAKVVYVADKIEVSREGVDPVLRKMCQSAELDTLFRAILNNTVSHLKARHLDISYGTRRLLTAMEKRNKHEKGKS